MTHELNDSHGGKKWALLIGINRYQYAKLSGFEDLDGCINDVEDMKLLLTGKFGFPREHVRMLKDNHATRAAILASIRDHLVAKANAGDIVVLYYSGHGSEAASPTRMNEREQTLVPHDGRDPDGKVLDISGKDLNDVLAGLKTGNTTFIFDSCHSGAILARTGRKVRAIPPDNRRDRGERASGSNGLRPPFATYALLAACAQNELSIEDELKGKTRGLLTYFFCEEIRRSNRPQTYRDLMDSVRSLTTSHNPNQHPQLEGAAIDTYTFGDTEVVPLPYVLVSPQGKDEVLFDGGAELGMSPGSIYQIYAPEEKQLASPDAVVATARVTSVQDFAAIGHIDSGGPVPANSRAVETSHYYAAPVTRICTDRLESSEMLEKVGRDLAALPQVRLTGPEDKSDIRIWQEAGSIHMEHSSGMLCAAAAGGPTAVEETLERVRHWARWLNLLQLNNPAQPALDVQFKISPVDQDYFADSEVQCLVENNSDVDLYITILDFSDDGSIQVIYPANDPPVLQAKHRLQKRFLLEPMPDGQELCNDVLKLIASVRQRDFRILETDEARDARGFDDPFGQLLFSAAFGAPRGQTQSLQNADWTAINRPFATRVRAASTMAKTG